MNRSVLLCLFGCAALAIALGSCSSEQEVSSASTSATTEPVTEALAPEATAPEAAPAKEEPSSDQALKKEIPAEIAAVSLYDKMERVDKRYFKLKQAINNDEKQKARSHLSLMIVLLRSAWEAREEAGFKEQGSNMLEELQALGETIEGTDFDKTQKALDTVQQRCDSCHTKYLDEG